MPETITADDAGYACDLVERIFGEVGPGTPGSPQEWQRAAMIKEVMESHLPSGSVVEEFTAAPWAMLSGFPISALFMLAAVLLNISTGRFPGISPWPSTIAALALPGRDVVSLWVRRRRA